MTDFAWIEKLKRQAAEHFGAVGLPSTHSEEWRHTQIQPILKTEFRRASGEASPASGEAARRYTFADKAACEIVFVNGRFAPQLSRLENLPRGLRVSSLIEAARQDGALLERHLARHARFDQNPFVAWNTGHLGDGAFVQVARGAVIEKPIHLIYIGEPAGEPAVAHTRALAVIEQGANCSLVESYVGSAPGVYLTNAVTEIAVGADAVVDHCKLQQESPEAYHVATMQVTMDRASNFVSHAITTGARIARNDLSVLLAGEHAYATLNGLVLIGDEQHCDNHTLLHHEVPNCPSHELYKHVLADRATGVFKGKIFVQKDAQKTDSKQNSKTLLLSPEAGMNSQPALEIYADDVKCTHGSTTGPVDEEMVFYLRSRGIADDAARHLLAYAFAADVTRRIKVEPVRGRIEDFMAAQHGLPRDLRITDLGSYDDAAL